MILGAHVIFSTYGFWLPNEERGSWSTFVASWELYRYGPATKVDTRRSVARRPYDRARRQAMRESLLYPYVEFTQEQVLTVAIGCSNAIDEAGYRVHALAVMPDHVHAVLSPHRTPYERIIGHLKARATQQLRAEGLHPLASYMRPDGTIPTPWAERGWKVFLDRVEDVPRAIAYVERNPGKEGLAPQRWPFVVPYRV